MHFFTFPPLVACLLVGLSCSLAAPRASASDREDHDRARQAVQAGQVLPLRTVLEKLERAQPGQVMEVELERESGRWIYEVKLLQTDGRLVKLKLDAQTAAVLRRQGKTETP